jgi:hypothetical protein
VVDLSVDGVEERSRPFWLACGAEGGNPFRVVFDVVWTDAEGTDLAGPPTELDRSTYELTAESARGTASCTYGPTDLLTCTYANTHGHEAETDALIVPAGRRHTFSVAQTPLPAGWEPSAGLGTFLVRDVCPRDDHGGHDGGEDPEAATRAHDDVPCLHVVVDVGPPPPPTTTTTTTAPTTTPTTSTSPTGVEAATSPVPTPTTGTRPDTTSTGSGTLPATGVASLPLGAVGGALVVLGTVLRVLGRRVP